MQCEQIQIQLSTSDAVDARAQEHLQTCSQCREFHQASKQIAAEISQIEIPALSPVVFERVKSTKQSPRSVFVEITLSLASVGMTVLILVLLSSGKAEAAYKVMRGQLTKVQTAHLKIFWRPGEGNVEDGNMQKIYELWWKPGAWRESASKREGGDRLQIATEKGIIFHRYDESTKSVLSAEEANMKPNDFSLEMVAKQYMETPVAYEQQPVDQSTNLIIAINKGQWSRIKFYVDRSTNLPRLAEKEYRTNGTWKISGRIEFEFNRPISSTMFEPSDLIPKP